MQILLINIYIYIGVPTYNLLTCLVNDAHRILAFFHFACRNSVVETTCTTRRAVRIGLDSTLGLSPFTRLACLVVNDVHINLFLGFVAGGRYCTESTLRTMSECITEKVNARKQTTAENTITKKALNPERYILTCLHNM